MSQREQSEVAPACTLQPCLNWVVPINGNSGAFTPTYLFSQGANPSFILFLPPSANSTPQRKKWARIIFTLLFKKLSSIPLITESGSAHPLSKLFSNPQLEKSTPHQFSLSLVSKLHMLPSRGWETIRELIPSFYASLSKSVPGNARFQPPCT